MPGDHLFTQHKVVATIGVRDIPWDIHVSRDGKWALVPVGDWERPELAKPGLAVIDTATRTVTKTIDFPERNLAFAVTSTHDGSRILVATSYPELDGWHARVYEIGAGSLEVVRRIDLGPIRGNWGKFALTADDLTLYLSGGQLADVVFVIDLRSFVLKEEIRVPVEATELALSTDEGTLYVLSSGSHQLLGVDLQARRVENILDFNQVFTGTLSWMSGDTRGLDLSPDGRLVWIGASEAEAVVVGDLPSRSLVSVVKVNDRRSELWDMVISPDGLWAYVGENMLHPGLQHSIIIIDVKRNAVAGRIPLEGGGSVGMAISPDGKLLYVAQLDGQVAEIDLATRKLSRQFRVLPPTKVAAAPWMWPLFQAGASSTLPPVGRMAGEGM